MSRNTSSLFVWCSVLCLTFLTATASTTAQAQTISADGGNCMSCHENLYFLHDTGNWFCLRDSPMSCVDCHGGDPEAMTEERAHFNRAAHPVVNKDISKCQECHPEECSERLEIFDQTAGLSRIRVAAPFSAVYSTGSSEIAGTGALQPEPETWSMFWDVVPLILVTGMALSIYVIARRRRTRT